MSVWKMIGWVVQYAVIACIWLLCMIVIATFINWAMFYSSNWRTSSLIASAVMGVFTLAAMFKK